ncbi:JAB domain-containing protein [Aurantiacibacter xanthus]|nr:JAB domain-containing protein [Aurantiacibacter xanthus]
MTASREALCQALEGNGAVAEALLAARTLVSAGWREAISGQAVDAADPRLAQYLLGLLQNPYEERLHAIFLTASDHYIRDEEIAAGSRSGLSLRMRTIVRRAFELDAHKLILAHNHPSGVAAPSKEDRLATARFEYVARELELVLVDHLIVGAGQAYSMRRNSLLPY